MGRSNVDRAALAERMSAVLALCDEAGLLIVGAHMAAALEALDLDRPVCDAQRLWPADILQHIGDRPISDGGNF